MFIGKVVLFLWFAAVVVSKRDVMIVDVEKAFSLVDFVASEYFNIDPFVVL